MEVNCVYIAASVNRSPHCLSWHQQEGCVIFGTCNAVGVAQLEEGCIKIKQTLVAHTDRVNCVQWISDRIFVSASTDGTARLWTKADGIYTNVACLKGHGGSVTCAHGFEDQESECVRIATASNDSTIKLWRYTKLDDTPESNQTIAIHRNGFALDLKLVSGPENIQFLFVSTDTCKIIIYTSELGSEFVPSHTLIGHEDWVQCLAVSRAPNSSDLLLASGGQDSFIRIWKISPVTKEKAMEELKPVKDLGPEDEIRQKEDIFAAGDAFFSAGLESILAGHEDKIYGLKWTSNAEQHEMKLLSCSLDKTMILWHQDHETGIWIEKVRVGEVGGNTLGFLGCDLSSDGRMLLGYNFTGAFHFWKEGNCSNWEPGVAPGGHHGIVTDLDWDKNGRYFVSVSADQTTRVHAPWRREKNAESWAELARAQVHGHDLTCLTMLPNHRFATGAEEKIVRVFESTKIFLENLSNISKLDLTSEILDKKAHGASVPSLGLSNKAVDKSDLNVVPEKARHVKDQYPDFYFTPESYQQPPSEDSLFQNTLWPELQKLYGHGYEIFCLASDSRGSLIASACKASKAEHAQVFLWDTSTWKIVNKLAGHSLTVTQMEFSPCDNYLLTVSRDRTWALYQRDNQNSNFTRIANTDKATSVHQRLIWSCSWSSNSVYFCTASRDKKIAIWSQNSSTTEARNGCLGNYGMACSEPLCLSESITAVAFGPKMADGAFLLAAGLETGAIVFISWSSLKNGASQWKIIKTLDSKESHHKAVKKLRFCPIDGPNLLLASCSEDHFVKLFSVHLDGVK